MQIAMSLVGVMKEKLGYGNPRVRIINASVD